MIKSLIKSLDELRSMRGNYATYEDLIMRCYDIADEIEREVESNYIERPIDADGMTVLPSDSMVDSNGEQFTVSSIELLACGEWIVYGNGKLGSVYAKLCHHYQPSTVEDVLEEALNRAANLDRKEGYWPSAADITNIVNEVAPKLQLKETE